VCNAHPFTFVEIHVFTKENRMKEVTSVQAAMDRYHALFGPEHLRGFVGRHGGRGCATHRIAQVIAGLHEHWGEFPEWFKNRVREKLVVEEEDGEVRIGLL
jgi:hypothetical protein